MAYDVRIDHEKIKIYKSKQNGRWVVSPPSCVRDLSTMTSYDFPTYEEAVKDCLVVRVLIAHYKRKIGRWNEKA